MRLSGLPPKLRAHVDEVDRDSLMRRVATHVPRSPTHVYAHAIVWEANGRYADVESTSEGVLVGLTDFGAHREVIEVDPRNPGAAADRIEGFLRGVPARPRVDIRDTLRDGAAIAAVTVLLVLLWLAAGGPG